MKNVFPAAFEEARAIVGDLEIELEGPVEGPKRYVCIRPEDVLISRESASTNSAIVLRGEIRRMVDHGFYFSISVKTGGLTFQSVMPKSMFQDTDPRDWQDAYVHLRPSTLHTF
jgi:ABC-type Fe3+/spermidine/putrescine transport system ATPase subunit